MSKFTKLMAALFLGGFSTIAANAADYTAKITWDNSNTFFTLAWYDSNDEVVSVIENSGDALPIQQNGVTVTSLAKDGSLTLPGFYYNDAAQDLGAYVIFGNIYNTGLVEGQTYTLAIPEGIVAIYEGDMPENDAQNIEFTYNPQISFMDPADITSGLEGTITQLAAVTMTWDQTVSRGQGGYSAVMKNLTTGEEQLLTAQGMFLFLDDQGMPQKTTVKTGEDFYINLAGNNPASFLKEGSRYSVVLPAGCVQNEDGAWNPEQEIAYFTYGEDVTMDYTASIVWDASKTYAYIVWKNAQGENVDALLNKSSDLPVKQNGVTVTTISRVGSTCNPGTFVESVYGATDGNEGNNVLMANMYNIGLVEGETYTIDIPADLVVIVDENWNMDNIEAESISFTYNPSISWMNEAQVEETMNGFVNELSPVSLSWGEEVSIAPCGYAAIVKNLTDGTQTTITSQGIFLFLDEEGKPQNVNVKKGEDFYIDFTKDAAKNYFTLENQYEIILPAGIVLNADGDWNPEQQIASFTYTSESGVDKIQTENDVKVVYNLQGVKVLEGDNAAEINNLPKGIYIVNGKKVMVK